MIGRDIEVFTEYDGTGPEPAILFEFLPDQLRCFLRLVSEHAGDLQRVAEGLRGAFSTDAQLAYLKKVLDCGARLRPDNLIITPRLVTLMGIGHANTLLARCKGAPLLRFGAPLSLIMRALRYGLAMDSFELAAWSTMAFAAADGTEAAHADGTKLREFARMMLVSKRLSDGAWEKLGHAQDEYQQAMADAVKVAVRLRPGAPYARLADVAPKDLTEKGNEEAVLDVIEDIRGTHPEPYERFKAALQEVLAWMRAIKRGNASTLRRKDEVWASVRRMDPLLVVFLAVAAFDHLPPSELWPWVSFYEMRGVAVTGMPKSADMLGGCFGDRRTAWRLKFDTDECMVLVRKLEDDERRRDDVLGARFRAVQDLVDAEEREARERGERARQQHELRQRQMRERQRREWERQRAATTPPRPPTARPGACYGVIVLSVMISLAHCAGNPGMRMTLCSVDLLSSLHASTWRPSP